MSIKYIYLGPKKIVKAKLQSLRRVNQSESDLFQFQVQLQDWCFFLLSTFRKNNIKKFLDKWSINFLIIGSRYMSHMRSQAKKTNAFSLFSINHLFEKDKGTRY